MSLPAASAISIKPKFIIILLNKMLADDIDHTKLVSGSIWNLEIETKMFLVGKKVPHVTNGFLDCLNFHKKM